jgi:hypothetical protein
MRESLGCPKDAHLKDRKRASLSTTELLALLRSARGEEGISRANIRPTNNPCRSGIRLNDSAADVLF